MYVLIPVEKYYFDWPDRWKSINWNKFHIDQKLSKSPSKIPFTHYDVTDDNPVSLSKQDQSLFMKIVGSLLFLSTRSRPDISLHVNYLSLFMKSATIRHLHLACRVLQYISQSKSLTLQFQSCTISWYNWCKFSSLCRLIICFLWWS